MAKMFTGGLSDWIRGAQSIIHEWRMFAQSLVQTFFAGLIVVVVATVYFAWAEMEGQERHALRVYARAAFNIVALSDPTRLVTYRDETGQTWMIRSDKFTKSQIAQDAVDAMLEGAKKGAVLGGSGMAFIILGLVAFFYVAGRRQSTEDYVRGARTETIDVLARKLKSVRGGPGVLRVSRVAIPRAFEPQHFLFLGATGTGKTQLFLRLFDGVRRAGQRAVIYDVNGSFVERFYRPGIDVILNPLDRRCAPWDIWSEVRDDADYDRLAQSLIPDSTLSEPFWTQSARVVFSSVAAKMAAEAQGQKIAPSNRALYEMIVMEPLDRFIRYCRNTPAAGIMDKDGEKMTASVRATLAANIKGFGFLKDADTTFSIRDFVTNENSDAWLFITSKNDQLAALRGLITLWVDTATATLLSMSENSDRRIWLGFDELTSLNRLSSLAQMMAQSRKFGGCAALGFQSFAQLVEIYRREGAEAVAGNCTSWFLLRPNDPMTAKWCSESLGKSEKDEAQEGVSVGRHEMRDGRTLQKQRVERSVVMQSELRNLPDLHFYLSLGRGLPIVKSNLTIMRKDTIAAPFEEATDLPSLFKLSPKRLASPEKPTTADDAGEKTEGRPDHKRPTPAKDAKASGETQDPPARAARRTKPAAGKTKSPDERFYSGISPTEPRRSANPFADMDRQDPKAKKSDGCAGRDRPKI